MTEKLSELELMRRQAEVDRVWQAQLDRWEEEKRLAQRTCHRGSRLREREGLGLTVGE